MTAVEAIERVLKHSVLDPIKGEWILPRWWKKTLEEAGVDVSVAGMGELPREYW
jgi:hypothetical protein